MVASARKACIVGIGETDYKKWGGIKDRNEFQLACQAVKAAAEDAGLPLSSLDGFATYGDKAIDTSMLQLALGIPQLRFSSSVWGGRGGGSCGALAHAMMAVETGNAECVAIFRTLAQGQSRRYGRFDPQRVHGNMTAPFGLFSAPQMVALVLQRYRHEYQVDTDSFGAIAMLFRANAQRNPRAVTYGKPLTREMYLGSRMIAEPLRLFDCCLETDGACALVVTTRERARDLRRKPVEIIAAAQGGAPGWSTGPMGSHNQPADEYATGGQRGLARDLFARAGMKPTDISVAQFYDHFSGMVMVALEDFGFCERGEGSRWIAEGNGAWPDGRMPLNTAGGSLSEAYVHGLNHVLEGVRQLRGESTSQVAGATTCLITGGSVISPSSAAIIGT
jgi:acetyl-CoA acetyltransferase